MAGAKKGRVAAWNFPVQQFLGHAHFAHHGAWWSAAKGLITMGYEARSHRLASLETQTFLAAASPRLVGLLFKRRLRVPS